LADVIDAAMRMMVPHAMRVPDLDLDLLRGFVTVAERGGFTAAGSALGLTQSAISLKVKRLEDILGKRVLDRGGRGVALTRDGETLLAYAHHFIPRNLAPVLARFAQTYPQVRLEVEVGRSHELRGAMADGALDLVLGKRRDGETEGRPIFTETIVWVAAPGWDPPADRPLPIAMLPQGCMFRDRALAALARAGMAFEVVFTSASLPGVAAAAQAGFATTVLGRAGLPPGLVELPALPGCGTAEMCLFGDAEGRSALVEPLIGFIRDSVAAAA